jgi:hypothetical protein
MMKPMSRSCGHACYRLWLPQLDLLRRMSLELARPGSSLQCKTSAAIGGRADVRSTLSDR